MAGTYKSFNAPIISQFLKLPALLWSTPFFLHPKQLGESSESHLRWWSQRGCHQCHIFWLKGKAGRRSYKDRVKEKQLTVNGKCISLSQSDRVGRQHVYPVTTALLTIRHILHGCNHRTTQMNGAQRVITLTESKEGYKRRQTIGRGKIMWEKVFHSYFCEHRPIFTFAGS